MDAKRRKGLMTLMNTQSQASLKYGSTGNKTITFDLFPVAEICPVAGCNVLVVTKSGKVTTARHIADRLGDTWINNNVDTGDHFFCHDEVKYWAYMYPAKEAKAWV